MTSPQGIDPICLPLFNVFDYIHTSAIKANSLNAHYSYSVCYWHHDEGQWADTCWCFNVL